MTERLEGYERSALTVIDKIYAAAAREIRLDDALESMAEALGDFVVALFGHDTVLGETSFEAAHGIDRQWMDFYDRRFGAANPLLQRGADDLMRGQTIIGDKLMPWDELQKTDYYREFLGPLKVRHTLATLVSGQAQKHGSIVTARAEERGPYRQLHLDLVDTLRPHLARALHILEFFEGLVVDLAALRSMVDDLSYSVLVLDESRRCVFANRKAAERIAAGDGLFESAGRIGSRAAAEFITSWERLVRSGFSSRGYLPLLTAGDALIEVSRLAIADPSLHRRLWVLNVRDLSIDATDAKLAWRTRHGLSEAECAVGVSLLSHDNAVAIAHDLGLSADTVRSHLKRMFTKLGVRSQTALALRLARNLPAG